MPDITSGQLTTLTWNSVNVGHIWDLTNNGSAASRINIGSFEDTVVKTRAGRRPLPQYTYMIYFNPDETIQATLETDRIARTEGAVKVTLPEGTIKTISYNAKIVNFQFGFDDNDVWKGQITLQATSRPVRGTS